MTLAGLRLGPEISTARPVAVGVAVVGSVLVFAEPSQTSRWVGYYQDTGMYLSVLSFAVVGSLFAVAGYWTGAHGMHDAPQHRLAVRSGSQILLLRAGGDLAWLVAALMVIHVSAYLRTAAAAGVVSSMGWSLSLLGTAAAIMCYALAVLIGSFVGRTVGVFLVAPLPYAATLLANSVVSLDPFWYRSARLMAPYIDQTWGPALVPRHGPILLLASYCLLTAATAFGVVAARAGSSSSARVWRRPLWWAAAAALTGALVATSVSGDDYYEHRHAGYRCDDSGRFCAWDRGALGGVETWTEAERRVRVVLDDLPAPALRFAEPRSGGSGSGTVELPMVPGTLDVDNAASVLLTEYVAAITTEACSPDAVTQARADLETLLRDAMTRGANANNASREVLDACA